MLIARNIGRIFFKNAKQKIWSSRRIPRPAPGILTRKVVISINDTIWVICRFCRKVHSTGSFNEINIMQLYLLYPPFDG